MKPISNDKRSDIIAAKQRGEPVVVIKRWFNVSDSTISRIWTKFKKTGSYLPIPYQGRRSDITPERDEKIKARIKENPDITLEQLLSEEKINLSVSGLSRRLSRMGLSYKKRHSTPTDSSEKMLQNKEKHGKICNRHWISIGYCFWMKRASIWV